MIHTGRMHQLTVVDSVDDLAEKLTQHTWVLCAGFRIGNLILLNDSTSEEGASEWAIFWFDFSHLLPHILEVPVQQIESITFGWMDQRDARATLEELVAGRLRTEMGSHSLKLNLRKDHRCVHCA